MTQVLDQSVWNRRCLCDQNPQARLLLAQIPRRLQHDRQERSHLLFPASRQQSQERSVAVMTESLAPLTPAVTGRHRIEQGVPHKAAWTPRVPIQRFLEG